MLLGTGPRLAWVQGVLDGLSAGAGGELRQRIVAVIGPPTREGLAALVAEPIDTVVLVDHAPRVAGPTASAGKPGPSPVEAVRGAAQHAILALELGRRAARTVRLAGDDAERWPWSLAATLGLPPPAATLAPPPAAAAPPAACSPADRSSAARSPTAQSSADLPPADLLMASYLAPLFAAAPHGGPLRLAWPREVFLDGDAPGRPAPAMMEVAGRARILAYGPYLPLPEGSWRARAFLGFSRDIGKMPFILEADCGGLVSRGFFEVERGGIFTLDLDFQVTDPMHPVEMRLISQESALEGQVSLIEVALEELR